MDSIIYLVEVYLFIFFFEIKVLEVLFYRHSRVKFGEMNLN